MPAYAIESEAIEQLLKSETEFLSPSSVVAQARLKDYPAEYRRSVEDPEGFWVAEHDGRP
jgi:acetyl-CoA synthetase